MKTAAVIVAAGKGSRMHSDIPKQYLTLCGMPVLCHSVRAFQKAGASKIVVVVAPGDVDYCREEILAPCGFTDIVLVEGGKERHDSVYQGLLAAAGCEYVWIHDGARPLIDQGTIGRTLDVAMTEGACVAAMPVKDTIKVADDAGYVAATPERAKLWQVQTPQTFSYELICKAHQLRLDGMGDPTKITDDGMLVEQLLAKPVKLVEGSYRNLKITTEEDMKIAEALYDPAR